MGALRILLLFCRHLLFQTQPALGIELVIAAGLVAQLQIVQMQNPGHGPVEQAAIM